MSYSLLVHTFEGLTKEQLYQYLELRVAVFVVEQKCPYQELDGKDYKAIHFAYQDTETSRLAAYLRVLPPGDYSKEEVAIGRVITPMEYRGRGVGKKLIQEAIDYIKGQFPDVNIRLVAQAALKTYYRVFGFEKISQVYDWDGIPHIDMRLSV